MVTVSTCCRASCFSDPVNSLDALTASANADNAAVSLALFSPPAWCIVWVLWLASPRKVLTCDPEMLTP